MSNCNKENTMAIQLAPLVGAGLGALQQSKIEKALAGTKTYTKPKTIFGKLIGGVSGRTKAAEATQMYKSDPISQKVYNAMSPEERLNVPVSGGISFGGEAGRKTYLPFAIIAAVVAAFYLMRKKYKRRR
jgi:hypothetical protein